jgi:hypothetical protein
MDYARNDVFVAVYVTDLELKVPYAVSRCVDLLAVIAF